jgi:hypothetical protein
MPSTWVNRSNQPICHLCDKPIEVGQRWIDSGEQNHRIVRQDCLERKIEREIGGP